jgi:hypothetical protein
MNEFVHVIWGEGVITPGLVRPLTRWERIRCRIKAPYWRLRYAIEDLADVTRHRVAGAWRVLLGRADWH